MHRKIWKIGLFTLALTAVFVVFNEAQAEMCCVEITQFGGYRAPWVPSTQWGQAQNDPSGAFTQTQEVSRSCSSRACGQPSVGQCQGLGNAGTSGGDWVCPAPGYKKITRQSVSCTDQACQNVALTACGGQDQSGCDGQIGHCIWYGNECLDRRDGRSCYIFPKQLCGKQSDGSTPGSTSCTWNTKTGKCNSPLQTSISDQFKDAGQGVVFSSCGVDGSCDSLSDLISLNLNIVDWIFGLLGVFAFGIFIFGGTLMIISFGNPERFQKGTKLLVGAVIGLVISLSAYMLVKFVLDALGVVSGFRAL